jgi:uncharacterized paraquat-inducible protein A
VISVFDETLDIGCRCCGLLNLAEPEDRCGRWSMINVFMISILVALVRFGQFANIRADVGAACFAAVVVRTMFAVVCFDPRLMWSEAGVSHGLFVGEPSVTLEDAQA